MRASVILLEVIACLAQSCGLRTLVARVRSNLHENDTANLEKSECGHLELSQMRHLLRNPEGLKCVQELEAMLVKTFAVNSSSLHCLFKICQPTRIGSHAEVRCKPDCLAHRSNHLVHMMARVPLSQTSVAEPYVQSERRRRQPFTGLKTGFKKVRRVSAASELTGKIKQASTLDELLHVHKQHADVFDSIHLSAFWNSLGKLSRRDATWLQNHAQAEESLCDSILNIMPTCRAQACATVAHGMAKAGVLNEGAWTAVWAKVADQAMENVHELNPQGLAITAWAFATVEHEAPTLFKLLAAEAAGQVSEFSQQNLANIAWAFAKVGDEAPGLFEALAKEATRRAHEFNAQDLANTAWAFAKAEVKAPALFDALAENVVKHLHELNQQNLANVAWAFAKAGHQNSLLFEKIAGKVMNRIREFTAKSLANIAWAFAKAGHESPELFDVIADHVTSCTQNLNPRDIANIAWAFATVGHGAPMLFHALGKELVRRVDDFKQQDFANSAWAFASLGYPMLEPFHAIAGNVLSRMHEFNPRSLANIASSFVAVDQPQMSPMSRHDVPELLDTSKHEVGDAKGSGLHPDFANLFHTLRCEVFQRHYNFAEVDLLSLCGTYSSFCLLDQSFRNLLTDGVLSLGRSLDEEACSGAGRRQSQSEKGQILHESGSKSDEPYVLSAMEHWMALYKPPFWLVSVDFREARQAAAAGADLHGMLQTKDGQAGSHVHRWICQNSEDKHPIHEDPFALHGIVHRLDVQTSGLLLCANSYAGANWLNLQWSTQGVEKEYVCLVHGWVDRSLREVSKRIFIDNSGGATQCTISTRGKASYTEILSLMHLVSTREDEKRHESAKTTAQSGEDDFTLVILKLHTGRRHQIRVHMQSIGHPLVCDSKYCKDLLHSDQQWCSRNFLHTYRMGFEDVPQEGDTRKHYVDLKCPLPKDLRMALRRLRPVDSKSTKLHAEWLSGDPEQIHKFDAYAQAAFGAEAHTNSNEA